MLSIPTPSAVYTDNAAYQKKKMEVNKNRIYHLSLHLHKNYTLQTTSPIILLVRC